MPDNQRPQHEKKYFSNIKRTLNSMLDYAVDEEIIEANRLKDIKFNANLFRPVTISDSLIFRVSSTQVWILTRYAGLPDMRTSKWRWSTAGVASHRKNLRKFWSRVFQPEGRKKCNKICYTFYPKKWKKKGGNARLSAFPPPKNPTCATAQKTCARGFEANLKCPKIQ